jgi:AcrR family transcriptional regulator
MLFASSRPCQQNEVRSFLKSTSKFSDCGMGLRAQQKEDRTARIIAAASGMFRTDSFDAVRMEMIAAQAGVSPGTVYNYFPTKGDLLVAIVAREVEEVLAMGARVVADPPADVAAAICALVHGYYDHSLNYVSKEMWRVAMAMIVQMPDSPASRQYVVLDELLRAQVGALIATLQRRGHVRADVDPLVLGTTMFHDLDAMFRGFVTSDQELVALKAAVDVQLSEIVRLIVVPPPS